MLRSLIALFDIMYFEIIKGCNGGEATHHTRLDARMLHPRHNVILLKKDNYPYFPIFETTKFDFPKDAKSVQQLTFISASYHTY